VCYWTSFSVSIWYLFRLNLLTCWMTCIEPNLIHWIINNSDAVLGQLENQSNQGNSLKLRSITQIFQTLCFQRRFTDLQKLTKLQSSTLVLSKFHCILHNNANAYFYKQIHVTTFNYKANFILEFHNISQNTQHCIFKNFCFTYKIPGS